MKLIQIYSLSLLLGFLPASVSASSQTSFLLAKKKHSSPSQARTNPVRNNSPLLEIKVGILFDAPSTTIASSQNAYLLDRNGQILQTVGANQGLSVQPNGNNLLINNRAFPGLVFLQPPKGHYVYIGDKWYRGKVLVVSKGSTLLAVNYVDLEEYLYSVVGSEMHPSEHLEALKAQAIAARSYAIVHMIRPASPWYHLGRTTRWQAYNGLSKEFNTTTKAVNKTSGQILSYKGGVVESLYADSDYIVATVHKGQGMSQTGAYKLANQGYNYQQILGRYYPGVSLARLVLRQ